MTKIFQLKYRIERLVIGLLICAVIPVSGQSNALDGMIDAKKEKADLKRDPFWPVGFAPTNLDDEAARKAKEAQKASLNKNWNAAMKNIVINGVSSRADDEFFAVINGEVKRAGDAVALNFEGTVYTWTVESITPPGSVKLRRVTAQ